MSLSTKVLIGMGLGILAGIFFGEEVAFLKMPGDAFILLLQMTVLPYIMVSLITGLGGLSLPLPHFMTTGFWAAMPRSKNRAGRSCATCYI